MFTPEGRLKKLINFLRFQRDIVLAYVPCALADEDADPGQKIEMAILFSPGHIITHDEKMKLADGLAWIFDASHAEVCVLNCASPERAYHFIFKGVAVLARNEEQRIDFESEILGSYLDTSCLGDCHVKLPFTAMGEEPVI